MYYWFLDILCRRNAFACHQQVENGIFANITNGFLVGDHCEVVPIALQYLIVNAKTSLRCRATLVHIGDIDAL